MLWHLIKNLLFYMGFPIQEFLKNYTSRKKPPRGPKHLFLNFCLILNQNAYNFEQNCQNCIYFWSCPNMFLKIRKFGHFSMFLMMSPPSHMKQGDHFWFVRKYWLYFRPGQRFISFGWVFQILTRGEGTLHESNANQKAHSE